MLGDESNNTVKLGTRASKPTDFKKSTGAGFRLDMTPQKIQDNVELPLKR